MDLNELCPRQPGVLKRWKVRLSAILVVAAVMSTGLLKPGLQSPASFSDSHRVGLACMHAILVTMGTLY